MQKFFRYLSPAQQTSWNTWFENERNLSNTCNEPVEDSFFSSPDVSTPSNDPTSINAAANQESDFQRYLPHHLPPLNRLGVADVPELLRAVAPDFPEYTSNQGEQVQASSRRPVALQPATFTGTRSNRNVDGERDFSDLGIGDMVLWLRDDEAKSEDYPFWMSKVLRIQHTTKTVRVRWYDKVPVRATRQMASETPEYATWSESKWQPWWNTYTEEDLQREERNHKKRRHKMGQPYKMAEEDMMLTNGLVFFYGFQLTTDNRISKATAKKIQYQLTRETASQLREQ